MGIFPANKKNLNARVTRYHIRYLYLIGLKEIMIHSSMALKYFGFADSLSLSAGVQLVSLSCHDGDQCFNGETMGLVPASCARDTRIWISWCLVTGHYPDQLHKTPQLQTSPRDILIPVHSHLFSKHLNCIWKLGQCQASIIIFLNIFHKFTIIDNP